MKRIAIFTVIFVFVLSLAGCATSGKQKDLENQSLRNQISLLDAQIQNKDAEISNLKESLAKTSAEKELSKNKSSGEVKSRPTVKQIQSALMNAGYNSGSIDGRMGKQTKDAIRAFQKANNLAADGKVGKQTWALLRAYLDKKVK